MPRLNVHIDDDTMYKLKRIALDNKETLSDLIRNNCLSIIEYYDCNYNKIDKLKEKK